MIAEDCDRFPVNHGEGLDVARHLRRCAIQKGFVVEGIISDQGTTFRGAASERGLNYQVDWWHVKRTLYKLFLKELQDAVRAPVAVDNASCIEDLWLATIAGLREWLTARGLAEQAKASLKEALVKAVCEAMGTNVYKKMTPEEAKWKFPELIKVVRMGGECSTVEVPVNYGEVPGASDADAREQDEGAERPAVDVPTRKEWNVDVQWEDVEELWSYDVHPTQGAQPASLASTLIMLAHAGANGNSHFIGGSTPWPNLDTGTGMRAPSTQVLSMLDQSASPYSNLGFHFLTFTDALDGGGADTEVQNPNAFSEPETLPRWTGRRKRKRGEDQIDSSKEEQTVAQRLSSHFYHVMMRCGAMKKEGHPMTPADVARELGSPPNHWAGDHSGCGGVGDTPPRCVREGWGKDHAIYEFGSSTHKAVREWFSKHLSPEKVESFVHGASSSLNESFHSLIIKYAPKRIRFQGSFPA
ncbi:unnamed protein product [Closterium sp. Yama58-4]|nr:unnamed protein product [Closterium sp. Yama58-4]